MLVGIHQPNYLPYLGFFDKMKQSDLFIIYDDAQFNKEDFQHRNKIRIYHEWKWLTVPVFKKPMPLNEIIIQNELTKKGEKWQDLHFRVINDNYKDAPYFHIYENELKMIYNRDYNKLIELNMSFIDFLRNAFDINTEIVFSSKLGFSSKSTERLVEMVEAVGGDVYLSGPMGQNYLNLSLFEERGIKVKFQDFTHPIYKQRFNGFIPNMSAIDALLNIGKLST